MSDGTGLYFEDFTPGREWTAPGRTVTEADIINFCGIGGDFNQLHTDAEFVRRHTGFKDRVAHGPLILTIAMGAMTRTGILEGTALAAFGLKECNYLAPVYAGDTITTLVKVIDGRPTSKGGRGIVRFRLDVRNQEGQGVLDVDYTILLMARSTAN